MFAHAVLDVKKVQCWEWVSRQPWERARAKDNLLRHPDPAGLCFNTIFVRHNPSTLSRKPTRATSRPCHAGNGVSRRDRHILSFCCPPTTSTSPTTTTSKLCTRSHEFQAQPGVSEASSATRLKFYYGPRPRRRRRNQRQRLRIWRAPSRTWATTWCQTRRPQSTLAT